LRFVARFHHSDMPVPYTEKFRLWLSPLLSAALPIVVALTAGIAAGAESSDPPQAASAEDVFEAAKVRWLSERPPPIVRYAITFHALRNGEFVQNHYRAVYRAADNLAKVARFSDEEMVRPQPPAPGFNLDVYVSLRGHTAGNWRLSAAPPSDDFIGYPDLAPRYLFGLDRTQVFVSKQDVANEKGLTLIGRTRSVARSYDISFAPNELPWPEYHLLFRPLIDPRRDRVREMWVDSASYTVDRIVTAGNFTEGPSPGVRWITTFCLVDGVQYIRSEEALAPLRQRGAAYENATLEFDGFATVPRNETTLLLRVSPSGLALREPD